MPRTYSRFSSHFRNNDLHAVAVAQAMRAERPMTIIGEDVSLSSTYHEAKGIYIGALVNCHVPYCDGKYVEEFKATVLDYGQGGKVYVRRWASQGREIVMRGQMDLIG